MSRVVKRSASQAVKAGPSRRTRPDSPLPQFIPPQLSLPVEKPSSGPQWVHEIRLDGFRMAARTGEVIGARKSEIDLDAAVWTIPAERMKSARGHRRSRVGRRIRRTIPARSSRRRWLIRLATRPSRHTGAAMRSTSAGRS
jgi:integrase